MTAADLVALLPIIALALTTVAAMLVAAFVERKRAAGVAAIAGLGVSLALVPLAARVLPAEIDPLLVVDGYALIYIALLTAGALAVAALGDAYFDGRDERSAEFFVLLPSATLGAAVLVASRHFASLFLGLELLSVSLFALIAYLRAHGPGLEAGAKYLVLSGVSSATLLFGMALIYAGLGTLELAPVPVSPAGAAAPEGLYASAGIALFTAAAAFKLSLVPFHMWTPDVYAGAPAPVTALLSTVSKGAVFAMLLRYFTAADIHELRPVLTAVSGIAVASMLIGNLLAVMQDDLKRILAYSSIAHVGYLLVPFLADTVSAPEAVTYYLAAYFAANIGAFGIIAMLSPAESAGDGGTIGDVHGLFWRRPWLAGAFTLMLLSLAGIPVTMGFVAKFYLFAVGVEAALWPLVAALVVGSAIGLFYYLRVIAALFSTAETQAPGVFGTRPGIPVSGALALAGLTVLVVGLGGFPAPVIELIRALTADWASAPV